MTNKLLSDIQKPNYFCRINLLICLGISIIVSIASVTNQSLWIDEAATAWLASHPTFNELIDTQIHIAYGETQKLFHVWYIWGWEKLFGLGMTKRGQATFYK